MIDVIPSHYKLIAGGLIVAGCLACAGFVGWQAKSMQAEAEIASLKATHALERERQATAALTSLKAEAAAVAQAATEYAAIETALAPKIAALTKELRNAPKLPPDCVPTPDRVRNLDAAIDAANSAIAR